jgi:dihydrofolate reductase
MEGDHEQAMFGVFETAAGMLLGRKNYQGFAAVWPPMAGDGAGPTASTQCQSG